ncbi:glutamate racemase [Gordonibacter sp. Marseille-P4307]|uniref:glutamate racemase n=1 Tax=Gordonibacter sp. Marseille-P4307 TaxID=2161815 RepID=UPI000F528B18|nr:glutamate racemase [Gordonibacter sp. Marseille-P4307]
MDEFDGYIGVFDSGVGGISVLKEAVAELPHENFLFFGDSAHAPYGEKSVEWVRERSEQIVDRLIASGVKAVVIACNTATSAAAEVLRAKYPDVPIVGVEPALKPAAISPEGDRILVMATQVTLGLEKFHRLSEEWGGDKVHTVACDGLAARIEQGNLGASDLAELLESLIGSYRGRVTSVVLGCTHYPFIARQIQKVLGDDVMLFDGGEGTARHLALVLEEADLLSDYPGEGIVEFRSSKNYSEEIELYRWFFDRSLRA